MSTSRSIMIRLSIVALGIIPSLEAGVLSSAAASDRIRSRSSMRRRALSPLPMMRGNRPYFCWMGMSALAARNIEVGSFRWRWSAAASVKIETENG